MIKLMQHPEGPSIQDKQQWFKTYVDLANYAEKELPHGLYFARNGNANSFAAIREVTHEPGKFYVEGRGHV